VNSELPKTLDDVVRSFAAMPGIGKRTALRLALAQLKRPASEIHRFAAALINLADNIQYCSSCHNISDTDICYICSDVKRDKSLICVVEDIRDIIAIENTGQYHGLYHVLGGIISPVEGIGPSQLNMDSLLQKVTSTEVKEIIMALNATMEGDTTVFYLYKKLKSYPVRVSTIARGVAIGSELENADEATLGRSIANRQPYENSFSS